MNTSHLKYLDRWKEKNKKSTRTKIHINFSKTDGRDSNSVETLLCLLVETFLFGVKISQSLTHRIRLRSKNLSRSMGC